MAVVGAVIIVIILFGLIALGMSVRVLREYERGVIFRLGRLIDTKGPGLILLIPLIDRMVSVDLRTVTLNIPPQEVITRDNVPCRVNAVAYFRVIDQNRAVVEVENYLVATSQISQTALRSVLGKAELDQLLADRERLNEDLQKIIDESTEPWGVKVTAVEIKDVEIPDQMQRAMARQAEAERERRAKIINSEGEFQAAQKLTDAADIISTNPASLQLRYLQTLLEIGSNQNTTVVFPLPMDVLEPFIGRGTAGEGTKPKPRPPAVTPPRGGEPVPGVEGSGMPDAGADEGPLPPEPDVGPEPVVPPEDDSPASADSSPGGTSSRPAPGVTPPADDGPADSDLPPARS
jgi:regulator of protease activity HflC (stomatin/prohibitin superfamily)